MLEVFGDGDGSTYIHSLRVFWHGVPGRVELAAACTALLWL